MTSVSLSKDFEDLRQRSPLNLLAFSTDAAKAEAAGIDKINEYVFDHGNCEQLATIALKTSFHSENVSLRKCVETSRTGLHDCEAAVLKPQR